MVSNTSSIRVKVFLAFRQATNDDCSSVLSFSVFLVSNCLFFPTALVSKSRWCSLRLQENKKKYLRMKI